MKGHMATEKVFYTPSIVELVIYLGFAKKNGKQLFLDSVAFLFFILFYFMAPGQQ